MRGNRFSETFDEKALSEAAAKGHGWRETTDLYNAATGQARSITSVRDAACYRGIKLAHPRPPSRASRFDLALVREIVAAGADSWPDVATAYNARHSGDPVIAKSLGAAAREAGIKLQNPAANREREAVKGIQHRVARVSLYRQRYRIVDPLTDEQIRQALATPPESWPPFVPIAKPGDLDCSGQSRPGRIYRTSLPRRRTGRAS